MLHCDLEGLDLVRTSGKGGKEGERKRKREKEEETEKDGRSRSLRGHGFERAAPNGSGRARAKFFDRGDHVKEIPPH